VRRWVLSQLAVPKVAWPHATVHPARLGGPSSGARVFAANFCKAADHIDIFRPTQKILRDMDCKYRATRLYLAP
jgi:hypothetical protein